MSELVMNKPRVLPPKGLLIALVAQLPILASVLPTKPSVLEMTSGAILLTAGVVLNIWSERLFRRNNVGVRPFTPAPTLVARGPFRFTRNPMYLGLVCLNLGVTLFSGALANVWSSITLWIWLHYAYVLPEEGFLRSTLNSDFNEYAERVPRWLIRGT